LKQWYEELFTNFAQSYDRQPFTFGTVQETDFIEKEIEYNRKIKILDIGCGTGRHAIELAKRGYNVTGIDLSADQLALAKKKARSAGAEVKFLQRDARTLDYLEEFDLVIMICEGAFSLMETDEMNFEILSNATRALKKGGKLIMTTLNGLYPLRHAMKDFLNKQENISIEKSNFNPLTMRDFSKITLEDDSGMKKEIITNERYYLPEEIENLLGSLNYNSVSIHGCDCGNFTRAKQLTADDYEMLVIAVK